MRKPVPFSIACVFWAAALLPRLETTESIKAVFDSGVAAYDRGDYPTAFKLFSSIDGDDLAAMRNVAMMLRERPGDSKKIPRRPKRCSRTRAAEARSAHRPGRSGRHAVEGRSRATRSQARPALAGGGGRGQPSHRPISVGADVRSRKARSPKTSKLPAIFMPPPPAMAHAGSPGPAERLGPFPPKRRP